MYDNQELINKLTQTMDEILQAKEDEQIHTILEEFLIELTHSEQSTLFLFDPLEMRLYNNNANKSQDIVVVGSSGLLGISLLTQKSTIYNHLTSEKHYDPLIDNPYHKKLKGQIIHPLMRKGELIGVIRISRTIRINRNYTQSDLALIKSMEDFFIDVIDVLKRDTQAEVTDETLQEEPKKSEISKPEDKVETKPTPQTKESQDNDAIMLFLSNTVHDIRTPANSLFGFLDLIEERIEDEQILEFITNAKESAQFINTLTDSILDRVKYTKESSESKPTVINTSKFFSQIANIFSANMFKKGIAYLIYIDPLIPKEIEIEELKLKRVLINLIGNAYKFTPKDQMIAFSIEYDRDQNRLHFSIKDTGIGIAKESQEAIFKAFEQAQDDTSVEFGGTGLGLAISAKYVQEFGGKLELESELDKGSNFFFSFEPHIIDQAPAHLSFVDTAKYITILTDYSDCINAHNIARYLEALSIPKANIKISHKIEEATTHLCCFEHKLNHEILTYVHDNKIKMIAVEEELFTLTKHPEYKDLKVIAENTYYGDALYSMVSSKRKPRVLIADDNKINAMLIKTILESEYCEIVYSLDGQEALDRLIEGLKSNNPFSIIFADRHMPHLSGSEVIEQYKQMEANYHLPKPIVTVSITGDPSMPDEEKKLYDTIVSKPFNKVELREVFHKVVDEE